MRKTSTLCILVFLLIFGCKRDESNLIQIEELLARGVTMEQLYRNGSATIEDFLDLGYSYLEIYENLKERNGNYYYQELQTDSFIQGFLDLRISTQELHNAGISIIGLYFHGVSIEQFVEDGFSFVDIICGTRRVNTLDFIELGFDSQRLMNEGLIIETTTPGFYVMNYLHQRTGIDGNYLLDMINGGLSSMNTWRVPTLSELQFIYDNRDEFNFEINLNLHQDDPESNGSADPNFKYWLSSEFVDCTAVAAVISRPWVLNFVQNETRILCTTAVNSAHWIYLVPVIQL